MDPRSGVVLGTMTPTTPTIINSPKTTRKRTRAVSNLSPVPQPPAKISKVNFLSFFFKKLLIFAVFSGGTTAYANESDGTDRRRWFIAACAREDCRFDIGRYKTSCRFERNIFQQNSREDVSISCRRRETSFKGKRYKRGPKQARRQSKIGSDVRTDQIYRMVSSEESFFLKLC